jgi:hypothetical protein
MAVERACAHTVQRHSGNGSHVEGTRAKRCPHVGVGVVSWTGGSMCPRSASRGASALRLPGYARARGQRYAGA